MNVYLIQNPEFQCGDPDCWIVVAADEGHARKLVAHHQHPDREPTLADAESWRDQILADQAQERERWARWESQGRPLDDWEYRRRAAWNRGVLLVGTDREPDLCTVDDLLRYRHQEWVEARTRAKRWASPQVTTCTLLGRETEGREPGVVHAATFPG